MNGFDPNDPSNQAAQTSTLSDHQSATLLPFFKSEDKRGIIHDDTPNLANLFADENEAAAFEIFFPQSSISTGTTAPTSTLDNNTMITRNSTPSGYSTYLSNPDNSYNNQGRVGGGPQQQPSYHKLPLHFQTQSSTPFPSSYNNSTSMVASNGNRGNTNCDMATVVSATRSVSSNKRVKSAPFVPGNVPEHVPVVVKPYQESLNSNGSTRTSTSPQWQNQAGYSNNNPYEPTEQNIVQHLPSSSSKPSIPTYAGLKSGTSITNDARMNRNYSTNASSVISTTASLSSKSSVTSSLKTPKSRVSDHNKKGNKRKTSAKTVKSSSTLVAQIPEISEDETDDLKRRRKQERNMREQQRSHRITEQIVDLRKVLCDTADVTFAKTDKYSILCKAVDYIQTLQQQCFDLDMEHRKLVETISQTSELVHSSNGLGRQIHNKPSSSSTAFHLEETLSNDQTSLRDGDEDDNTDDIDDANPDTVLSSSVVNDKNQSSSSFFNSMALFDYKTIFERGHAAMAIFSLDGMLVDCNQRFETLIECDCSNMSIINNTENDPTTEEKNVLSLFHLCIDANVISDLCKAMEHMIEAKHVNTSTGEKYAFQFWSGKVYKLKDPHETVMMNLTLSRNKDGNPRFFNCALFENT